MGGRPLWSKLLLGAPLLFGLAWLSCSVGLGGLSVRADPTAARRRAEAAASDPDAWRAARSAAPIAPSTLRVEDVVFTMIMGGPEREDYDIFMESIRCIRRAAAPAAHVDFIGFHEGNVPARLQRELSAELAEEEGGPSLRFVDARIYGGFLLPPSTPRPIRYDPPRPRVGYDLKHLGYRHMCRFMALVWWRALSRHRYAMRVDEDVCVERGATDADLFAQVTTTAALHNNNTPQQQQRRRLHRRRPSRADAPRGRRVRLRRRGG